MATILFVDDDPKLGKYTKEAIESGLHSVRWVCKPSWTQAAKVIENDIAKKKEWDMLILDIHYPTDNWGGIWLFNHLVHKGFRSKWKSREIVYSQYCAENLKWENALEGQTFALRMFLETANIRFENALPNQDFDRTTLCEKIEEVLKRR